VVMLELSALATGMRLLPLSVPLLAAAVGVPYARASGWPTVRNPGERRSD